MGVLRARWLLTLSGAIFCFPSLLIAPHHLFLREKTHTTSSERVPEEIVDKCPVGTRAISHVIAKKGRGFASFVRYPQPT